MDEIAQLKDRIAKLEQTIKDMSFASTIPYDMGEAFRTRLIGVSRLVYSEGSVTDPPTAAELTAVFGSTPAELGGGFLGVLNDAGGGTDIRLITTAGTSWWYSAKLTAAT